jgi:hypothetical protein
MLSQMGPGMITAGAVKSQEILNGLALEVNNKSLSMGKTVAAIAQMHALSWQVP